MTKELTKLVKLILVPLTAEEIKEVIAAHWLLSNSKSLNEKREYKLHIPAAGGEYRRLIASGNYTAVKPYLICEFGEVKLGDLIMNTLDNLVGECILVPSKEEMEEGEYVKVIATPDQIFNSQIIMFNEGVKENFDHRAMGIILNMNNGSCKIQMETETAPKLENGKVVIVI